MSALNLISDTRRPTETRNKNSELDALDAALVNELHRDARVPYTVLSQRLGVTPITIQRRVQRLIEEGVVVLQLVANAAKLGYQIEAYIGLHVQHSKAKQVVEKLRPNPAVLYMTLTSGHFDILLLTVFRSLTELADFVEKDAASIDGIEWMETVMNVKVMKRPWATLPGTNVRTTGFDELDGQIIRALQADIRLPIEGIARKVGVAGATVRQRLRRLVSEGSIAFSTIPDLAKLGYQVVAHIGVRVRPSAVEAARQKLAGNQNVHYLALTTGRYDLMLWTLFQSAQDLTNFLQTDLAAIEGIEHSETLINLNIHKWISMKLM